MEIFTLPLPQYEDKLPLELAVCTKSIQMYRIILPYCSLSDDRLKKSSLFLLAAKVGFSDLVEEYVYDGWSISPLQTIKYANQPEQRTPLDIAAEYGHDDFVLELCQQSDKPPWEDKYNAIRMASRNGHCSTIRILLGCHAPLEGTQNSSGHKRPIMEAIANGHVEAVRILLDTGASRYQRHGKELLHEAAMRAHLSIVQILLKHGAEVEELSGSRTVIHSASSGGCVGILKTLLNASSNLEIDSKDDQGETPLMAAVSYHKHAAIEYLLAEGARIEERDKIGRPVLFHAVIVPLRSGIGRVYTGAATVLETVMLLCSHGANIHSKDFEDTTALMFAAKLCNLDLMRFLVSRGADVTCLNKERRFGGRWNTLTFTLTASSKVGKDDVYECILFLVELGLDIQEKLALGAGWDRPETAIVKKRIEVARSFQKTKKP
ncbi:hypothetical protein N0V90_009614 [Kalmusia sp. IMI 367209]|nr:hypothetical protein N0V90_009614 [Kalmusia sp. IMI 367209]